MGAGQSRDDSGFIGVHHDANEDVEGGILKIARCPAWGQRRVIHTGLPVLFPRLRPFSSMKPPLVVTAG